MTFRNRKDGLRLGVMAALALASAGCASAPPPPSVEEPNVEPLIRVAPKGFEVCFAVDNPRPQERVEVKLAHDPKGFVTEASVVQSTNTCFDRYVLAAIDQWRYPPRFVDGVLASRTGVRAVFIFNYNNLGTD